MDAGEGQEHEKGQSVLSLLDGYLAGRRQDQERASGELRENGCRGSPAEGQKGEGQGPGDQTLILSAKIVADMEPYLAKRNAEELSSLSISSNPQRLNRCLSPGTRCHRHS